MRNIQKSLCVFVDISLQCVRIKFLSTLDPQKGFKGVDVIKQLKYQYIYYT